MENQELPPRGGGEPAITCMSAVIANAVFDAVKIKLFALPMAPEKIQERISQAPRREETVVRFNGQSQSLLI
jgi:CO/xanthine dehydrogenase Mo-binding subunit